jgi:hypothetical protein
LRFLSLITGKLSETQSKDAATIFDFFRDRPLNSSGSWASGSSPDYFPLIVKQNLQCAKN